MRKVREVLRLAWSGGLELRKIERSLGVSHATAASYLARARQAGLSWPLPEGLDDTALERRLFPKPIPVGTPRPLPDWTHIHAELRRPGVTKALLWEEYKRDHPDGYQFSWFCERYGEWAGRVDLVMRQEHRAGEKLFVDYAGSTVPVVDRATGEILFEAQIFVAVLGASNFTYAEGTRTQGLPDWIGSHVRAFEYFGGVPEIVVPDNLRAGVSRACRYEPDLNPTYQEMATHYGTAVIPARVRKPRDKAKVEVGVLLVERWILAALRNRTFTSLAELNEAIARLLSRLNDKPFQKLPGSRRSLFETLEKPLLKPLPAAPYRFAEWGRARVGLDYHVEVGGHYYSVPHGLARKEVEVRHTATTIEILFHGQRVASHPRSHQSGRHTTDSSHMPSSHQRHAEWTPARIARWAESVGPETARHVAAIMENRPHPEQGFRSALGIMRLAKEVGTRRMEAACKRASAYRIYSYRGVANILRTGADRQETAPEEAPVTPIVHGNIRGPGYYH